MGGDIFCCEIDIKGRVQGVGFRPFIYALAQKNKLCGRVMNTSNGVRIIIDTKEIEAQKFIAQIKTNAPLKAVITHISYQKSQPKGYDSFEISHSLIHQSKNIFLSPDYAICSECIEEIHNPNNRRYQYAFTTCLNCGPRYSIQSDIPYDRHHTSMVDMPMCSACLAEYNAVGERRSYSQTNSCPECKIPIRLWKNTTKLILDEKTIIRQVIQAFQNDKIVAVKSLSGFLLCCNALSSRAIKRLRIKKNRPAKPFAVMYRNIQQISADYYISQCEEKMLCSAIAPIVLLKAKQNSLPEQVQFDLAWTGVFLPNSALFQIILDCCDFPLIATSGNRTNEPLCYQDDEAINRLQDIADLQLTYDRKITMPQDDSVMQFTPEHHQKIIIRRSRGLAPEYMNTHSIPENNLLAFGADMKQTVALQFKQNIYLSQYIGNCEYYETQQRAQTISHQLIDLLELNPKIILADLHRGFHSTQQAQAFAKEHILEIQFIQHHTAHFSALLEEHNLWNSEEEILGVIWDGTGLGSDRNIWGGEFFKFSSNKINHIGQMQYTPVIAGDKMAKEPKLSAFSFLRRSKRGKRILKNYFTDIEWNNYIKLYQSSSTLTSSMGRMFDTVACLLGICSVNRFEGQAAMLLENMASQHTPQRTDSTYSFKWLPTGKCEWLDMMEEIVNDIDKKVSKNKIAYQFHLTCVEIIRQKAALLNIKKIGFSGGVFQNAVLVDLIITRLGKEFQLFFHEKMSPNDENISFGQICYYNHLMCKSSS